MEREVRIPYWESELHQIPGFDKDAVEAYLSIGISTKKQFDSAKKSVHKKALDLWVKNARVPVSSSEAKNILCGCNYE